MLKQVKKTEFAQLIKWRIFPLAKREPLIEVAEEVEAEAVRTLSSEKQEKRKRETLVKGIQNVWHNVNDNIGRVRFPGDSFTVVWKK